MGGVKQREWILIAIVFALVLSCSEHEESPIKTSESKPDERPVRTCPGIRDSR